MRLDRARRRAGLIWVAGGLAFEVAVGLARHVSVGPVTAVICAVVVVLADYTQVLLLGAPRSLAAAAAGLATIVEVALSVLLVAGYQRRWVAKATAGLLAVYLLSMTASVGLEPVVAYAVPVLIGGALLISACPPPQRSPSSPGTRKGRGAGAGRAVDAEAGAAGQAARLARSRGQGT